MTMRNGRRSTAQAIGPLALLIGCAPADSTALVHEATYASAEPAAAIFSIDLSIWNQFKTIRATLMRSDDVDADVWDAYAATVDSVNVTGAMAKRSLTLAFDPNEASHADALSGDERIVIDHLRRTGEEIEQIDAYLHSLDHKAIGRLALVRAQEWLPHPHGAVEDPVTVRFVPLGPDAYGERSAIIFDPLFAFDIQDNGLTGVLAHELHHVLVQRMEGNPSLSSEDVDRDLLAAISQLQLEGTADLIDKYEQPYQPLIPLYTGMANRFNAAFASAPATIRLFDQRVSNLSSVETAEDRRAANAQIRAMFELSGHPDGLFMAKAILQDEGKEALIQALPSPFAFLRQYNKAARNDPHLPQFSDETMAQLRRVEARAND